MKITKPILISILLGVSLILAACGPKVEPTPTVDTNAIMTQVAMTVQAEVTQNALLTPSATIPPPPTATIPPVPTQSLPTAQPAPAGQPTLPAASPDNALWIADVTVPDNTVFWKNESFTKTWKIENSGTTTWDSTYKLVYVDGPVLGETLVVSILNPVKPKNQIELSVPMKAPSTLGTVTNYWRMMNGKGQFFGDVLYLKIVVGTEADKTVTPSG